MTETSPRIEQSEQPGSAPCTEPRPASIRVRTAVRAGALHDSEWRYVPVRRLS